MTRKKPEAETAPESLSRRDALRKLGLGTAVFVVPTVATVSDAKARPNGSSRSEGSRTERSVGSRGSEHSEDSFRSQRSPRSRRSHKGRRGRRGRGSDQET